MLKRSKCILLFTILAIFSLFGMKAGAEDYTTDKPLPSEGASLTPVAEKDKFLVTSRGDLFCLYYYGSDEEVYSSLSIEDILSYSCYAEYFLDGVEINDALVMPKGDFVLSGSAVLYGGMAVFTESNLTLSDLALSLNGSGIRIMGGSLTVTDSRIDVLNSIAIEVGYSYSSSLIINSGELRSSSSLPIVDVKMGRAVILSGSIKNSLGEAIYNRGSLFLSGDAEILGARFDIITEHPINLSYEDKPFLSKIRLQYDGEFEKGSMHEILRSCTEESTSQVRIYDKCAKEYELSFFESYKGSLERNFAAVYLPFSVRIFDGDTLVNTFCYLKGELPDNLIRIEKTGYLHRGFYLDEEFKEELSADIPIAEDIALFVKYELSAPEFSLRSLSFTYDAAEHILDFSTLSHPLEAGGLYRFEWFYNGNSIGFIDGGVSLLNVSDSGTYFCTVTFLYGKDHVSVTTPEISVSISKKQVEIPVLASKEYNGRWQSADISNTLTYTVQNSGGTDAGNYPVYLALTDSENYAFSGASENIITIYFEIQKSENRFLESLSILDTYANVPLTPSALAKFGEVTFKYSDSIDGVYSKDPPNMPGVYYVIAEVADTKNYCGIRSEPVKFNIMPERAISLSVISPPDKRDYIAFDHFLTDGLVLELTYNSGRREIIDGSAANVSYQSADELRFGDNAVILGYLGLSTVVPITVARAEYDLSSLSFPSLSVTFDGEFHTAILSGEIPIGKDGISPCARIVGGGNDAGIYTVYLEFTTDSKNYVTPSRIEAILTVTPLSVFVEWGECEFIYDGKSKLPSAYFLNELGAKITLTPSGAVTNATENAVATVTEPSGNYCFINPTAGFRVKKANFDLSGITWGEREIVYCGTPITVALTSLPEGLYVIGYTDNTATEVGNYTANARLSYDERNYNPPIIPAYEWSIVPAEYDISGIAFKDAEFVFDGNIHYPMLEGVMPTGLDGIPLEYYFSEGATHASDEKYEVRLIFKSESKNYKVPEELIAYVKILPKRISVIWEYTTAVYDGEIHIPNAACDECEIIVSGGGVGAGRYTAYAKAASADFEIINDYFDYEIKKAQNYFTESPAINDFYESQAPAPSGTAKEGEVIFEYFLDSACTRRTELPLSYGAYYMRATAPESDNYTEYMSAPIRFEVVRVVPVGIEITLIKNVFVAFEEILQGDLVLTAVYSDGTRTEIPYCDIDIEYESADSLRVKDKLFTVGWQGFTLTCELSVIKADYDLSGVRWENTVAIYNGELKHPTVTGLPLGVSVREYVGGGRNAGEYTTAVILDYDAENYNPPLFGPTSFIITPAAVEIPTLESAVYNGSPITVRTSSELYDIYASEMINAGKYTVLVKLRDSENYIFEDGTTEAYLDFTVQKKVVNLKIEDLTLYLFERERMPEYTLTDDSYTSAVLDLYYKTEGDRIYILSANPNFVIEAQGARLIRSNRLSARAREWVAVIIIIIIILLLLAVVFIKYKDRIFDRIARARCKIHMAKAKKDEKEAPAEKDLPKLNKDTDAELFEDIAPLECERNFMTVNMERADSLISDSLAKSLLRCERETVYTTGYKRGVVNVDTLSETFEAGEVINVNDMKKKRIVSQDTLSVKVLARGRIDKPLSVKANAFSLSAVKMIALSGGEAIKVSTKYDKSWAEKNKDTIEKDTGV